MIDLIVKMTIEVAYSTNGTDKKLLMDILEGVIHRADDEGLFTGELDAELEWWDIIEIKEVTADEIPV